MVTRAAAWLRCCALAVAALGCQPAAFSRDVAFSCARDSDCLAGLVCLAQQCLPPGTEVPDAGHVQEAPDAGPLPPPTVLTVAASTVRTGYGAHVHSAPVPPVAAGNFIFLQIYARYSATPLVVPDGYTQLHESHAVHNVNPTAEPRHVILYRRAERNEDGGTVSVTAYNTAGPPAGDANLGISRVQAVTVSAGILGTVTRTSPARGAPLPSADGPTGTLVLYWYAATAGNFFGPTPTSEGTPSKVYAYATPSHQALYALSKQSDAPVDGGIFETGGGAFRDVVVLSIYPGP
ncbi:MAG: hypothetical protein JNG84_00280 [Archangium sp.]|nr:hypothetical protein [Archangium sp.]